MLRRVETCWEGFDCVQTLYQHLLDISFVFEMMKPFDTLEHWASDRDTACSQLCVNIFSTFLLFSKCWWCHLTHLSVERLIVTQHSLNIYQHRSTNVERMLRPFDRDLTFLVYVKYFFRKYIFKAELMNTPGSGVTAFRLEPGLPSEPGYAWYKIVWKQEKQSFISNANAEKNRKTR